MTKNLLENLIKEILIEDIELSKFGNNKNFGTLGFYALAQAFNRLIYKGIINAETIHITTTDAQNPVPPLNFSKRSFKYSLNPEKTTDANDVYSHDIIHLITPKLVRHFARLRKGIESNFNKTKHYKSKKNIDGTYKTPKNKWGPSDINEFGSELGQYAWEERVGNLVFVEIIEDLIKANSISNIDEIVKGINNNIENDFDFEAEQADKNIEDFKIMYRQYFDMMRNVISRTLHPLLLEYNKLLGQYKKIIMKKNKSNQ